MAIDDFATKKGKEYATVIIDKETSKYVDFVESRKKEDVSKVLEKYSNTEIVCRDRASSYGSAISEALPNVEQIADKFHLIMNLTEKGKEYIRLELPSKIYFDENFEIVSSSKNSKHMLKRYQIENIMYDNDLSNLSKEKQKMIKKVLKKYKKIKYFLESVHKFKNIINNNDKKSFRQLMAKWEHSDISVLRTFTKGVYKDFDAVINAVIYNHTNAIAEGKINKIKTIKRVCYGRASFELLTSRLFLADYFHSIE